MYSMIIEERDGRCRVGTYWSGRAGPNPPHTLSPLTKDRTGNNQGRLLTSYLELGYADSLLYRLLCIQRKLAPLSHTYRVAQHTRS